MAGAAAPGPPFAPGPDLVGAWQGDVHTCEGRITLKLEITAEGRVYARLGAQRRTALQGACCQSDFVRFNNAGGGPFLRGWMPGTLPTEDVQQGRPEGCGWN